LLVFLDPTNEERRKDYVMKRSAPDANQMMLPLEKWIAEERTRSNACRPIGEITAGIIDKVGQRRREVGGNASGLNRGGEEETPRKETGPRLTGAETPASHAGAVSEGGGTIVDFLAAGLLRRRMGADAGCVMVAFRCLDSEPVHATGSGDDVWIPF
jgi:hypothetical protein